jgi:hypothetical protein
MMQAMSEKNWDLAVQLRGKSFQRNLETYRMLTRYIPPTLYIKGTVSSETQISVSYLEAFFLLLFNACTLLRFV